MTPRPGEEPDPTQLPPGAGRAQPNGTTDPSDPTPHHLTPTGTTDPSTATPLAATQGLVAPLGQSRPDGAAGTTDPSTATPLAATQGLVAPLGPPPATGQTGPDGTTDPSSPPPYRHVAEADADSPRGFVPPRGRLGATDPSGPTPRHLTAANGAPAGNGLVNLSVNVSVELPWVTSGAVAPYGYATGPDGATPSGARPADAPDRPVQGSQ
ncbi:hypothetical protein [Streptoalloteichus tenebrarius]|uniref:hypothetical protein n=1 Tax=Streptoalloteichus tenebrarius (strain ATCC 17920 / DSM 40477 / JCM 4838 / CBS 697.72 / NBRC 16177 / NCIMB 11028 / NRRL B-12390 / A12253. 1 / ISP 5477) TaxID=1933 RepID=UPI0020A369E5|nr:hypothetical protein [Streptoalloteichus tenebrarius]